MSYKKLLGLVSILIIMLQVTVLADFKKDEPVTLENADGSCTKAFVTGDEYVQILHDADGYVLVKTESGIFEYAFLENGELVPCGYKKGIKYAEIPEEYFNFQREKVYSVMEEHGIVVPGSVPRLFSATDGVKEFKGNGTVIVVPIAFSDGSRDFAGFTQSVENACEYYNEVSYGALRLGYFDVSQTAEVFVSEEPELYYHPYDSTNKIGYISYNQRIAREEELVKSAIEYYGLGDMHIDSPIDVDGDGANDFLVFVYNTVNESQWNSLLWPHQIEYESPQFSILGKNVSRWIFMPRSGSDATLCHEMYHAIGAPDLYGYSDQYNYIGMWDIMDGGNGSMLTHMKYHYGGWIDEIPEITKAGTYTLNPASESDGNCYKIPINESEYYVVEYRNRYSGKINYLDMWRQWHNEGLLITKVNSGRLGAGNVEADTYGAEIELVRHPALGINSILGAILPEFSPDSGFDRALASGGTDNRTVIKNIRENTDGTLSFDLSFDGKTTQAYEALDDVIIRHTGLRETNTGDLYLKLAPCRVTQSSSGETVYQEISGEYGIRYIYATIGETSANSYEYLDYTSPFLLTDNGIIWAYMVDADGKRVGDAFCVNILIYVQGINTAGMVREFEYGTYFFDNPDCKKLSYMTFADGDEYTGKLNMDKIVRFNVDGVEYEYLSEDIRGKQLVFAADEVIVSADDGSEVYMKGLGFNDYQEHYNIVFDSNNGRSSIFETAETITAGDEISLSVPGFAGEIRYTMDGTTPTESASLYTQPIPVSEDAVITAASFLGGERKELAEINVYVQGGYREYSADELNRIFKNSGSSFSGGAGKYVKVCYTKGEGTLVLRDGDWLELCKIVNPRDNGVLYIDAENEIFVQEASGDIFAASVVDESYGADLTVLKNADSGGMVAVHSFSESGDYEVVVSAFSGERFKNATSHTVSLAEGKTEYLPFDIADDTIKAFCYESLEKLEPKGRSASK